jgi:DNA recombination protein RmuC
VEELSGLRLRMASLEGEREGDAEKLEWVRRAEENMRDAFKALAGDALKSNSETLTAQVKRDFQGVVDPLKESLTSLDGQVRDLEKNREGAYKSLEQQLSQLRDTHAKLQQTTITLTEALRSPTVRGRWGEIQLRRVVEMAGMVNHVAFDEQATTDLGRPDMIVRLPNGGVLPIDSKVPLASYLSAMDSTDDNSRKGHLREHARAMRARVKELGQKQYWDQFPSAPDFVVMFVPNEACLGAAFECDPGLLEYAIEKRVLISSPVTLLALLRAVAYGWQQHQITENAIKIANEGRELYGRLQTFIKHFSDVGESIEKVVHRYNSAVGSLDRRLIPAARRFGELGLSREELEAPGDVDVVPSLPASAGREGEDGDDPGGAPPPSGG